MASNSYDFVLDCSITMAWCFEDESTEFTEGILEKIVTSKVIVPSIWPLEVANVLLLSKKYKRVSDIEAASFIDALSVLPITVDYSTTTRAMHSIFLLGEHEGITIYDAVYLELAIREKIPLLTLNKGLIRAAKRNHVPTVI